MPYAASFTRYGTSQRVLGDGGHRRQDHDRKHQRRRREPGTAQSRAEERNPAQALIRGIGERAHRRHDDEEPPQSVDDARDRRQQLHDDTEHVSEPGRQEILRQEYRHRDAEEPADREREQGAVQGAPDVRQHAELLATDVPRGRGEEVHAVAPDRCCGLGADLPGDRRKEEQNQPRRALGHEPEQAVERVVPARGRARYRWRQRHGALSRELHRACTLEMSAQPHWIEAADLRTTAATFSGSGM
jgi:hypothetical protein